MTKSHLGIHRQADLSLWETFLSGGATVAAVTGILLSLCVPPDDWFDWIETGRLYVTMLFLLSCMWVAGNFWLYSVHYIDSNEESCSANLQKKWWQRPGVEHEVSLPVQSLTPIKYERGGVVIRSDEFDRFFNAQHNAWGVLW